MGQSLSHNTHTIETEETRYQNSYSNIVSSGNSRVHNGNVYNVRNFYGHWPDSLPQGIRLGQYGAISNPMRTSTKRRRSICDAEDRPSREGNPFLEMAISQLGEFSMSLRHQKQDEAAQKIVSWVRVILEAIESDGASLQNEHTENELARMQNGLLLTNSVGINSTIDRRLPEQVIKSKRKCSIVVLGGWKIFLDTKKWEALNKHGDKVSGSFSALHLEPLDFASASPIAAFFGERTDHNLQPTVLRPAIFAYRTVSNQSEVFELIRGDNIAGLKDLILNQEATTWDCDEEGRTLLHHACWYCSSECLAFLLEHCADVDGMAQTFVADEESFKTPLSMAVEAGLPHRCIRLLLEAGGDITIPQRSNHPRDCFSALEFKLDDDMRSHFPFGPFGYYLKTRFVDVGAPTSMGLSIWLYAFHQYGYKGFVHPGNIASLLPSVCDINETTKNCPGLPDGWNCLFLLVLDANDQDYFWEFESLRLLLRHSVNIHAKDASGLTIFDHVNALPSKSNSYQRDLLYCALQREGVDIGVDQEVRNRTALYEEDYTPEHYRALCFLNEWEDDDLEEQVQELLEQHPWTEEEWLVMQPVYQKREAKREAGREAWRRREAEEKRQDRSWQRVEELSDSEVSEDEWQESLQFAEETPQDDIALQATNVA